MQNLNKPIKKLYECYYNSIKLEEQTGDYKGKKVKLDSPFRLEDGASHKFGVYVKDGDKTIMVKFGSPDMEIKRDDPDILKSFRARFKCDDVEAKGDKTSASWWSCKFWQKDKTVSQMLDD